MYTIYGTGSCKYCDMAKELLDENSIEYDYYDVTENVSLIDMFKSYGWKTVPQVFYGDTHVGGYDQLVKFIKEMV